MVCLDQLERWLTIDVCSPSASSPDDNAYCSSQLSQTFLIGELPFSGSKNRSILLQEKARLLKKNRPAPSGPIVLSSMSSSAGTNNWASYIV